MANIYFLISMLTYPNIDPVIVHLGPLALRWYGMMYVLGFSATYFLVSRQIKRQHLVKLAPHFENFNMTLIISVVLGGRLGYVVFYNLPYYLGHPLQIFNTLAGGMSFHGGVIGVLVGGWWFCRRHDLDYLQCADLYVATIPVGLGLGRLGNFINGELYGRVTEMPWGMVFPGGGSLPRHPSQLYEAFLEGVVLFILLALAGRMKEARGWGHGAILALFLVYYGILRCFVELFRQPDVQIGLVANIFSRGQLLSFVMIGAGIIFFSVVRRRSGTTTRKPGK